MAESRDLIVVSNHLLRAGYQLTEWEHRLINMAAAQVGAGIELSTDDPFVITVEAMKDLFDPPPANLYRSLERATKQLMRRVITYRYTPEGRKKPVEVEEHWVRRAIYDKGNGQVILYWESTVIPYLSELSREFTQYQLADIAKLSGKWAPRLYQLLMTYRSVGHMEIGVEDLRYSLQVGKSCSTVAVLKRDVLMPAIAELNDKLPSLKVKMSERKLGRRIIGFQFSFIPSTVAKNKQGDGHLQQDFIEGSGQKASPNGDNPKAKKQQVRSALRDIRNTNW